MKKSTLLTCLGALCVLGLSGQAADVQPVAVGEPAVTGFVAGRPNVALSGSGGIATANTFIPEYFPDYVNDGVLDETYFPWIPLDGNPDHDWIRIELAEPTTLSGIVLQGRFDGRSAGTYTIQATTDAPPIGDASNWTEVGTYTFAGAIMPRTAIGFSPIEGVTAVQVLTKLPNGLGAALQEIELYGPFDVDPSIVTPPAGGIFVAGGVAILEVEASAAESLQWQKDGVDIEGATGSRLVLDNLSEDDAGSYTVVATNFRGSATSAAAVITVTDAPVFDSYREAVLSDNPLRYYPFDDEAGAGTAADLGSEGFAGTFTGGITLAQPGPSEDLGTAIRLDGTSGTLVDLGLFHPGDTVSIEAWARLDSDAPVNTWHSIVARWDGSYELDIAPGDFPNLVIRNDANAFGGVAGASSIIRGQWYHIVGVFDGGILTIYVNGVRGTEANIGGVLQNLGPAPDRVMIGATREGVLNFKGMIDEVAIYPHALPPEKIRAHYQAALPDEGPELSIVLKAEISWPAFPAGYTLQVADSADPEEWQNVELEDPIISSGDRVKAYVPVTESHRFYRLFKP